LSDLTQNAFGILEDLPVGEPQNEIVVFPKIDISVVISICLRLRRMNASVDFDDQASLVAEEVRDERPIWC